MGWEVVKVATVRTVVDCRCGNPISFYPATEAVSFLVKMEAPADLPICTERCRSCRSIVPLTLEKVGWRVRV